MCVCVCVWSRHSTFCTNWIHVLKNRVIVQNRNYNFRQKKTAKIGMYVLDINILLSCSHHMHGHIPIQQTTQPLVQSWPIIIQWNFWSWYFQITYSSSDQTSTDCFPWPCKHYAEYRAAKTPIIFQLKNKQLS